MAAITLFAACGDNLEPGAAKITVTPVSGLSTTEGGGEATFTVVLETRPMKDVVVDLSSSDDGEGTVSPASLRFTKDNFDAPQMVTVKGVQDDAADGAQNYTIITARSVSDDYRYGNVDAADVEVSNTDDDTAGATVTPTTALTTTEAGGTATFTVVLNSRPTSTVTLPLSSDSTDEGTVAPASLMFTVDNWNAPQTVTVTGVNDAVADGNQVYTIVTAAATSADMSYAGINPADVTVTNTDNDTAGMTITPTSGLQTTEAGATATFTVVLNSQPTANVTIGLSSSDTTEGTAVPTSVTFTTANWNAPQTVTVTGANDAVADGNQLYTIVTAAATSSDATYQGINATDVSVTNVDNDSAGFIVTPTTLTTTETGGQATFTIVLTSQPTADVTVAISSSNTAEGTVDTSSVTFTTANWNAPHTITVSGEEDAVADGNQLYTIVTDAATSTDVGYAGVNPANVTVSNTDNDTAGITVSPTTGLQTSEAAATAQDTFTIVLNSQPTANVTIALSSSDTSEGTVSPASVTFTTANWNAPQTVTVTGVNDFIADGGQVYTIVTAAATSADATYQGTDAADLSVTNLDNDSASIIVSATSGLSTGENGDTATFTIVLASQPTASVTIGVTTGDPTEGDVDTSSVTFTTLNWNAPQTITVTGVDDAIADGNQVYTVVTSAATSGDPNYMDIAASDVSLTNVDDDTAGILVNPTSGLVTSEAGGAGADFAIVLRSQPTANVTISLVANDPTEGSVSPSSVTFTPLNWNAPQLVTVTGVDDAVADGNQVYLVTTGTATSSDPNYNGLNAPDVSVTTVDNDSPGIRVTPTSGLTTTENLGEATFEVVLESQPTMDVTIALSSSDTTEGTITQSSLTFTPANWSSPQTVTVTGVNDAMADGNQPYSIVLAAATSGDAGYNGVDAPDVAVTNIDNDTAGVIVTPTSGLTTTEAGDSAFFTVELTSQPAADVTITFASDDTTEGTMPVTSVTFTSADWNQAQTVNVVGVDDAVSDGNQPYSVVTSATSSADATYNGLTVADVSVTNTDNDIAGITLDPTGGLLTSEFLDFDTFTIVLNAAPTSTVTIGLSSSDTTEATVSPASVTFDGSNWNVPQTVTVTGVDDLLADGNQPYFIVTAAAVSSDPNYNGMNAPDLDGSNFDNDVPGVYVKARRLLRTSENGQSSTFRMSLTTAPSANVTCTLSSSDTTEGTVSPTTLTFTPANFATLQNVTVAGVNDPTIDGDQLYTIVTAACTSADPTYNNMDPRDVSVLNRDND